MQRQGTRCSISGVPLAGWLAENHLSAYLAAFEEDGYDAQVLSKSNEEESSEVMDDVKMKKGHRRKLLLALGLVRVQGEIKKARDAVQRHAETQSRQITKILDNWLTMLLTRSSAVLKVIKSTIHYTH